MEALTAVRGPGDGRTERPSGERGNEQPVVEAPLSGRERVQRMVLRHRALAPRHAVFLFLVAAVILAAAPGPSPVVLSDTRADASFELMAAGEVRLGSEVRPVTDRRGPDWPAATLSPIFAEADTVAAPITHPFSTEQLGQRAADPAALEPLAAAGLTAVVPTSPLFDDRTIVEALDHLDRAGLSVAGAGERQREAFRPLVEQLPGGSSVATFGFADQVIGAAAGLHRAGVATTEMRGMIAAVAEAAHRHDLVVVHLRAGVAFDHAPQPRQVELARMLADAGADLVVGHGAQVVQPVERYGGAVIAYSTGAFVGGPGFSRARDGIALRYRPLPVGVEVVVEPLVVREGQPLAPSALRAARIRAAVTAPVRGVRTEWMRTDTGGVSLLLD